MGGRRKRGGERDRPRERGKVGRERRGGGTDRYWESEIERRSWRRERGGGGADRERERERE